MSAAAEIIPTTQPDNLQLGWTLATIDDLVNDGGVFIDGDWVESKDQDPEGDVRLIQLADIGDGEYRDRSARFLTHAKAIELGCTFLKKGDVLIARMPDPLGRACIFPGDSKLAVTVVDVAIVRSAAGEFNHRWLMYFVNAPAFRSAVASMQSGSTRKRISRGNLAKIALPVPPLHQQKHIVAEIEKQFSRLDEAVANLKRVKANLKRYKAAVLKAAVEGRLVETEAELARREGRSYETGAQLLQRILETRRSRWKGKGKYKEPAAPDTTDLPDLPEGWAWVHFGNLGLDPFNTVQTGPFGAQLHNTEFTSLGVPVIAVGNLTGTGFRTEGLYFVSEAKAQQLARYDVWAGDLLFARSGATLGKVCVAPKEVKNWRMTGHILRARLNTQLITPEIAVYALAALPSVRNQVFGNVRGVTRPGFNTTLLESIVIPVPPLAEQHRIVAEVDRRLSLVREVEAEVDANLKRAEQLRQSILARAFTPGRV